MKHPNFLLQTNSKLFATPACTRMKNSFGLAFALLQYLQVKTGCILSVSLLSDATSEKQKNHLRPLKLGPLSSLTFKAWYSVAPKDALESTCIKLKDPLKTSSKDILNFIKGPLKNQLPCFYLLPSCRKINDNFNIKK